MPKKRPPSVALLPWSVRELVEPGTTVSAVASGSGAIVMGGERLYRVPPGAWSSQARDLPRGTELPLSIAVEPRPPFRIALGPESGDIVIFTDTTTASSITGHAFSEVRGSKQAMELSWVVYEGQSCLFARTDDGLLYRMRAEGWDTLEIPPVRAIARDESGGFAALTVVDGAPRVYVSRDGGDHFHYRALGVDVEAAPDAPASLALSGMAVAVTVGDSGPLVSRGVDVETRHYPVMARAYTVLFGNPLPAEPRPPIPAPEAEAPWSLEPDTWIVVGLQREDATPAEVWLLDAEGNEAKVMDFVADDQEPLDLGQMIWDPARKAILIASRGGLIAMCPDLPKPRKPREKKILPQ